jgi:Tol biopolymer transport system component
LVLEPDRTLRFTTDEGTWISLDVAPNGRTIVFDLLGDLYTIPISGGHATRITEGMSWDGMPRWSPDGETIAFISDRDGGDNLWLVSPDGSDLRKLTGETTHTLSSPTWSPDGDYIVARRFGQYPSAENYLTNVPLWMVHVRGGSGVQIYPEDPNRKSTNTGATFSPDGKMLYFSSHGGGYAGSEIGRYQVMELDLRTGEERALTAGAGGGLRPLTSPDGRWLVYATRAGERTALRIRDLSTHEDRWLVDEIQRDDQEGYAPNDILPGYAFTPDSREVVFYGGGKIHRVNVETRDVTGVPFTVDVELDMAARTQVPLRAVDDSLDVTQLLWVTVSPDRRRLAFSAIGRVWTAPLVNGRAGSPARLTNGEWKEYYPAFSPDGAWIAYATWADSVGGYLWKVRADGSGSPIRLTQEPATIQNPQWSPEGDRIVYSWSPRRAGLGGGAVASLSALRSVSADGGAATTIAHAGAAPSLVTAGGPSAGRVYFTENVPNAQPGFNATRTTALVSVRLDGSEKRTHAKVTSPNSGPVTIHVAPDERSMLILERDDLYLVPLMAAGAGGLSINLQSPSVPLRRVTTEGTNYAGWADGGSTVVWSFASQLHTAPRDAIMASADPDQWGVADTDIRLRVARAVPRGVLVLRGARLITMNGDEIIERGDILIRDNRIAEVGRTLTAPADAHVVDLTGATPKPARRWRRIRSGRSHPISPMESRPPAIPPAADGTSPGGN